MTNRIGLGISVALGGLAAATPAAARPAAAGVAAPALAPAPAPMPMPARGPTPADALLRRLDALEEKVARLEARNAELEAQATTTTTRVGIVEARAAKAVQPGVAPTFADPEGRFTFKPRGTLDLDLALYNERAGGYDYDNGTSIRRGRFGFEGTAFRDFRWRLDAEFTGQQANILDAYVQYVASPSLLVTAGQHKTPQGLEANSSDNFNTFLERGMAVNAFGAIGAERRIGLSATYISDKLNGQIGLYGAPESQTRANSLPDETWGGNARLTWDPVLAPRRLVHLGGSAYTVVNLREGANAGVVRVQDRPDVRVDDGRILSVSVPFVRRASAFAGEGAVVFGPVSLQGEYGRLHLDRSGALADVDFDGGYVFASLFLTGESRTFRNGVVDRLKPRHDFDPDAGGWGAVEVALRYDTLSLTDRAFSPLARTAHSWTAGLNLYLNPNTKILINYLRFTGENSPLALDGTTAKGDAFATRLHFDF